MDIIKMREEIFTIFSAVVVFKKIFNKARHMRPPSKSLIGRIFKNPSEIEDARKSVSVSLGEKIIYAKREVSAFTSGPPMHMMISFL